MVRYALLGIAVMTVLVPGIAVWRTTTAYEWRMAGMGTLAEAKLAIGYQDHSLQEHEWTEGYKTPLRIVDIAEDPKMEQIRERLLGILIGQAKLGFGIGVGGVFLCAVLFWLRGRRMNRAKRIRSGALEHRVRDAFRSSPSSERTDDGPPPVAAVPEERLPSSRAMPAEFSSGTAGNHWNLDPVSSRTEAESAKPYGERGAAENQPAYRNGPADTGAAAMG